MPALRQSSARFAVFFLALLLKPSYIAGCLTSMGIHKGMPVRDIIKKKIVMSTMMLLFALGGSEVLLIFFAILLLFGGRKIPELMRGIGKGIREFNAAKSTIETELKEGMREADNKAQQQPSSNIDGPK